MIINEDQDFVWTTSDVMDFLELIVPERKFVEDQANAILDKINQDDDIKTIFAQKIVLFASEV